MKILKYKILFFFTLLALSTFAQVPSNFWFFGWGGAVNPSGIDFTSGSPVQYNGVGKGGLYESITIQSDATKVLFYSNSHWVRDQNNDIMPGLLLLPGSELKGARGTAKGSAVQGAVSFPYPGSTTRYVLVSTAAVDGPNHPLYYTDIDMTLAGNGSLLSPLGDIGVNVETDISGGVNTTEQVGIYAPSCDDIWLVSHEHGTDRFVAVKFTTAGPQPPVFSNAGNAYIGDGGRGTLRVSPDGTTIVVSGGSTGGVQIFSFNSTTGTVSNPPATLNGGSTNLAPLDGWFFGYGIEWSPNSRYFYVGGYTGFSGIKVYDTQTNAVSALTGTGPYGDLQMGPDGVIYCAPQALGGGSLATITGPDLGPGSAFNAGGYTIGASGGWLGLPNTFSCPVSTCPDVGISGTTPTLCVGNGTVDLDALEGTADPGVWSLTTDPSSGTASVTTSGGDRFNLNRGVAGTYILTYTIPGTGGACPANPTLNITVNALPAVSVNDASICLGGSAATFTATSATATGYVWSVNGTGTNPTTAGTTPGNYTVVVTDANGCENTATGVLTIDALPSVTVNDASICIGGSAATFTATSATATGYVWSVNGTGTNPTTTGTTAGNYTVVVTDGNGCENTATGVLTIDAVPSVTVNDASICLGGSAATFTATSATATGYVWSVNGTGTNPTTTGTTAGNYTVVVTDANGCENTATGVLTIDALPSVTVNDASICTGGSAATFTATSATATGYVWSVNGSGTNPTTTGTTAGNYTVVVTDANGCENTATGVLTLSALPIVSVNDVTICSGAAAATFTATAATATSYVWSANGTGTNPTTSGTTAGNYTVVVTDVNGCENTATGVLTIIDLPDVSVNSESVCTGAPASTFTATSAAAISYVWSANGTGTNPTTSGTTAGNYTVVITDVNGCTNTATGVLTTNALPSVSVNDASICSSGPAATFTATSATATGYVWSANGTGTNPSTTGTTAGNYTVVITDATGCTNTATGVLTITAGPAVTVNDASICIGGSAATFTATSATATGYVWSANGTGTNPTTTGNTAGNYTVVVTDATGCVSSATGVLTIDTLPIVTVNDVAICIGDPAGTFTATSVTATGYLWSVNGTGTNPTTTGAVAGNYTVTITDVNGCENSGTGVLTLNTLPVPTFTLGVSSACENAIAFNLTGGSPAGSAGPPVTTGVYSGNGVGISPSFDPSTAGSGVHVITYTYTDGNGCVGTVDDNFTVNSIPTVTLNLGVAVVCVDGASFALSGGSPAAVVPATGVYSGPGISSSPTFNPTSAGAGIHTITYTYTDAIGCSNTGTGNVTVNALPDANLGADRNVCVFKNQILLVPESGATYLWSPNSETTQSISTNSPGSYSVVVTDVNGCVSNGSVVITQGADLSISLGNDVNICDGKSTVFTVPSYDDITWSTGSKDSSIVVSSSASINVLVVDTNGCFGRDTVETTIVSNPVISKLRSDTTLCEKAGDAISLEVNSSGFTVTWQDGSVGPNYLATTPGTYIATIADNNNCTDSDTTIFKDSCSVITIRMPNVFTPGTGGVNDYFRPIQIETEDKDFIFANLQYIRFQVFDRWGLLMHTSEGVLPRWDGRTAEGKHCLSGTYFWVLDFMDAGQIKNLQNGFVELIRSK